MLTIYQKNKLILDLKQMINNVDDYLKLAPKNSRNIYPKDYIASSLHNFIKRINKTKEVKIPAGARNNIGTGDVNGDGVLNVLDVIMLVNMVLPGGEVDYIEAGDMNQDGVLDILDVVALVNLVLSPPDVPNISFSNFTYDSNTRIATAVYDNNGGFYPTFVSLSICTLEGSCLETLNNESGAVYTQNGNSQTVPNTWEAVIPSGYGGEYKLGWLAMDTNLEISPTFYETFDLGDTAVDDAPGWEDIEGVNYCQSIFDFNNIPIDQYNEQPMTSCSPDDSIVIDLNNGGLTNKSFILYYEASW